MFLNLLKGFSWIGLRILLPLFLFSPDPFSLRSVLVMLKLLLHFWQQSLCSSFLFAPSVFLWSLNAISLTCSLLSFLPSHSVPLRCLNFLSSALLAPRTRRCIPAAWNPTVVWCHGVASRAWDSRMVVRIQDTFGGSIGIGATRCFLLRSAEHLAVAMQASISPLRPILFSVCSS